MSVKSSAFLRKVALAMTILTSFSVVCAAAQASTVKTNHNSSTVASRVTGSVYCVHGTVTVKGWEQDLVKRNPGLRRFNWSPITAAKPGVMVFRQPGQEPIKSSNIITQSQECLAMPKCALLKGCKSKERRS
jgi:hypothetical protein